MLIISKAVHCNIIIEGNNEIPNVEIFVLEDEEISVNAILGMDLLCNRTLIFNEIVIEHNDKGIEYLSSLQKIEEWEDPEAIFIRKTIDTRPGTINAKESCIIYPGEKALIAIKKALYDENHVLSPDLTRHKLELTDQRLTNRIKNVEILNASLNTIMLQKDTTILVQVDEKIKSQSIELNFLIKSEDITQSERRVLDKEFEEWKSKRDKLIKEIPIDNEIDKAVEGAPTEHAKGLRDILAKYHVSFSRSNSDCGLNRTYVVDLKLKNQNMQPVFVKPYKLDMAAMEQVEKKLKEMISAGILETTISAWNSPLLVVKKKDNTLRIVNNFSARGKVGSVNENLLLPRFPLLPIRSILTKISTGIAKLKAKYPKGKICFSGLDVRNAFYSLSLRENSRDITSFMYGNNQMRYCRMSQGLSSSPANFQSFITNIMSDIEGADEEFFLLMYMDDFLTITCEEMHNIVIGRILKRIEENNLVIALKKCEFFRKDTKFLGYIINQKGIKVDEKKIDALLSLDYPKTAKECMKIIGGFNFYNRSIKNASVYLEPIAKGTSKGKDFVLTEEMKTGLDNIKKEIKKGIQSSHLSYVDGSDGYYIFMASDTSLTKTGSVVGNCRIVGDKVSEITISAYFSKVLTSQEALLSSRGRELIGIQMGLKNFADILPKSVPVIAFCDHKSLEGIKHSGELKTSGATRVRGAFAEVLDFPNLEIRYLPGTDPLIEVVDHLSRGDCISETIKKEIFHPRNFEVHAQEINSLTQKDLVEAYHTAPIIDVECVKKSQQSHDFYSKIIENNDQDRPFTFRKVDYIINNGLLYRQTSNGRALCVIPESLGFDIVSFIHIASFHASKKSLEIILRAEPLWLESKTKLIDRVCKNCLSCYITTPTKYRTNESVTMRKPALRKLEKIYIDIFETRSDGDVTLFLTMLDGFSMFLKAEVIKSKQSKDVIPVLMLMITFLGAQGSSIVISDNGGEFINSEVVAVLKSLCILQSHITPYNSSSNLVERCHRDLRAKMRLADLKTQNIELIVKMAVNYYNHSPKSSLENYTPMEIFCNISMPNNFGKMEISEIREQQDIDIESYMENFESFQDDIAKIKLEKYFLKNQSENIEIKEKDFVLIRDPRKLMGHGTPARGPYLVIKRKYGSAYELREVLTGKHVLRNSKFLIKLHTDKKMRTLLDSLERKDALGIDQREFVKLIWGERELVSSPLNCNDIVYRSQAKKRYNLRR
ncbi:unnamed protein product [Oikopleura dioica]|uniref:ribonuclease H n=1 Tax=Oikopleura dioica TaxID=34765 RepID=E4YLI0_OIKDI|nr:unnamed protein product [Oikopleura dioica]